MARWPEVKIEKEVVIKCLEKNKFLILTTANELGISRSILNRLIKEFDIPVPKIPLGKSLKDLTNTYITHPKYPKAKSTYDGIKKRCYNPKEKSYQNYGARGISMCDLWLNDFDKFFEYVVALPNSFEKDYSIDRINVNGNYEPNNIRFLTQKDQMNNTRSNRIIEYLGTKYTLTQFAESFGLSPDFVKDRLKLGFSLDEVVSVPKGAKRLKDKVALISKGVYCIHAWFRVGGKTSNKYFYYTKYGVYTLQAARDWLVDNSGFPLREIIEVVRDCEGRLLDKEVPYQVLCCDRRGSGLEQG